MAEFSEKMVVFLLNSFEALGIQEEISSIVWRKNEVVEWLTRCLGKISPLIESSVKLQKNGRQSFNAIGSQIVQNIIYFIEDAIRLDAKCAIFPQIFGIL